MTVVKRSGLIWSLLLSLVLMNGFMAAPSVAHAAHHENHQAGTHSTGLCAWQCAAGQGVESTSVDLASTIQVVGQVVYIFADKDEESSPLAVFFRGPPSSPLPYQGSSASLLDRC